MNGGSFSASILVAAYLKNNNRAEFIGEETGGTIRQLHRRGPKDWSGRHRGDGKM